MKYDESTTPSLSSSALSTDGEDEHAGTNAPVSAAAAVREGGRFDLDGPPPDVGPADFGLLFSRRAAPAPGTEGAPLLRRHPGAVSYTHLTLPTNREV